MVLFHKLLLAAALLPSSALYAQAYELSPGDVVVADRAPLGATFNSMVRLVHLNGSSDSLPLPQSIVYADAVEVDRDGALLISNYVAQWHPDNGIWRIDPLSGQATQLNNQALEDNFKFCRDTRGELVVADGLAGLARIDLSGKVTWFSPPSSGTDPSIGIDLDYDGSYIVSEAPNYLAGSNGPGFIHQVDGAGIRTVIASDPNILPRPQGLSLEHDGSIVVTDAFNLGGSLQRMGVVRVFRDGTMQQVAWDGLLTYPASVIPLRPGCLLVADALDASLIIVPPGGVNLHRLLWDGDDGIMDGNPIAYPRDLCQIPPLWVRTPDHATIGQPLEIRVSTPKPFVGEAVVLAASMKQAPTPMSILWSGDLRTSHVDFRSAHWRLGLIGFNGELTFRTAFPLNPKLIGKCLHLQAFMPGRRHLSNYIALPIY